MTLLFDYFELIINTYVHVHPYVLSLGSSYGNLRASLQ